MNGWRVILQIDTSARKECHTYADVPSLDPAHIAIVVETGQAAQAASRLFDELLRSISSVAPALPCSGPRLRQCQGRREVTCRSILVAVANPTPVSSGLAQVIRDWQSQGPRESVVLPILPAGTNPSAVFPSPLDKIIAMF